MFLPEIKLEKVNKFAFFQRIYIEFYQYMIKEKLVNSLKNLILIHFYGFVLFY